MTLSRFAFQQTQVRRALDQLAGLAVNVGCCDDRRDYPPESIKPINPDRVVNCDVSAVDQIYDETGPFPVVIAEQPTAADILFDCARDRWPFDDGAAAVVVLGDILEHLDESDMERALTEARRVGQRLCITAPEDRRDTNTPERADLYRRGHVHRTIVTEQMLRSLLRKTGWKVVQWHFVEYDDGQCWGMRTMGHFVEAR